MADFPSTASRQIRVLLVDDHPMMREQLAELISRDADMLVCGEAEDINHAVELLQEHRPEIAIVDIALRGSNGLDLLKEIKARRLSVSVLVLSMYDESLYAERALRAGARGYIAKSEAASEVMRAVRKVTAGEVYLSEKMTSYLIQRMSGQDVSLGEPGILALADRELEVFQRIGQGRNTHEIARELGLGESTVAGLRARIKERIGAKDMAELYCRATEWMKERSAAR